MNKKSARLRRRTIANQHKLLADHYLANGFRQTEAAIAAGYKESRARVTASEILARPDVQTYIDERMKKTHMSANEALARLGAHARGDITEFLELSVDELKSHPRAYLIKEIEMDVAFPIEGQSGQPTPYIKKVKIHDSQSALLNILKQHQLANGLPTEIVAIAPSIMRLIELMQEAGKDPAEAFERMVQRAAQQQNA